MRAATSRRGWRSPARSRPPTPAPARPRERPRRSCCRAAGRLSARISRGAVVSARNIATRCAWPPESSSGSLSGRSSSANLASSSRARSRASSEASGQEQRQGDVVQPRRARETGSGSGTRTGPARAAARRGGPARASRRHPPWARQGPPRMCRSVDLPLPEGPMIAIRSFGAIRQLTSVRTSTGFAPGAV